MQTPHCFFRITICTKNYSTWKRQLLEVEWEPYGVYGKKSRKMPLVNPGVIQLRK